jgi:glycosyltransferase involved in cell wall biosynthesis
VLWYKGAQRLRSLRRCRFTLASSLRHRARRAECGCTGMHYEAAVLLYGILSQPGVERSLRIVSNRCPPTDQCGHPLHVARALAAVDSDEYWAESPFDVAVLHIAFKGVCGAMPALPKGVVLNHRLPMAAVNVVRAMFEADGIPRDAAARCNSLWDEVWVPTQFNFDTFSRSGVDASKLRVVPEALDDQLYNPAGAALEEARVAMWSNASHPFAPLARLKRHGRYVFLSVFKWERRKNWAGLLQAYFQEFSRRDPVTLVLRTHKAWETDPQDDLKRLRKKNPDAPHVLLLRQRVDCQSQALLYSLCDAFVLPTHGEGWGLPTMEVGVGEPACARIPSMHAPVRRPWPSGVPY